MITFKQLDPRTPGDPREDERDLEDLLDAAQPGWRDVLIKRQYLPRMEAVGALPTAREGGFAGRPGPLVPGLQDLYLAGDWVGSEGFLVDASVASARNAARLVLEDVSFSREKVAAGSVRWRSPAEVGTPRHEPPGVRARWGWHDGEGAISFGPSLPQIGRWSALLPSIGFRNGVARATIPLQTRPGTLRG